MRLLIVLEPQNNISQPVSQHWLQSWIYQRLRNSEFCDLHNKERYKYFCFSNVFPFKKNSDLKAGKTYNLIISSPNDKMIKFLYKNIGDKVVFPKSQILNILKVNLIKNIYLEKQCIIKSATPIVVSLTESLAKLYNIDYRVKKGRPLYWNKTMSLNAFIDGLTKNLVRKYNKYYGADLPEDTPLFGGFKFLREALVNYKKGKILGSMWEFIPLEDKKAKKVLEFCLDAGFGEKNSAGFGFVNKNNI